MQIQPIKKIIIKKHIPRPAGTLMDTQAYTHLQAASISADQWAVSYAPEECPRVKMGHPALNGHFPTKLVTIHAWFRAGMSATSMFNLHSNRKNMNN